MTDRNDSNHFVATMNSVDDSESLYAVLPVDMKLSQKWLAEIRVFTESANRCFDASFEIWRK